MATAKKLPSGNFRVKAFICKENGKNIYKSFTAPTKKEAELMATQYVMDYNSKNKIKKNEITFETSLSNYISIKGPVLSPSTIRGYKSLERTLKKKYPEFTCMRICDITQKDVQAVISKISLKSSPKTVRNYHGLISSVIGSEIVLKTTLPQKEIPDYNIPTDEEIKKLISAIENTELEIPVLLAAFGMMRRGEICALTYNDVNFKTNTIHVKHSIVKGEDKQWHIKVPKNTSSDRYVHVPKFITDKIKKKGYITNYKPNNLSDNFRYALKKNNLPHFRLHDLRHYSASIRHALNIPDAYIMEEGGWKTDNILKTVYRHAMKDKKNEMTEKAINHFNELYSTKYSTEN